MGVCATSTSDVLVSMFSLWFEVSFANTVSFSVCTVGSMTGTGARVGNTGGVVEDVFVRIVVVGSATVLFSGAGNGGDS